MSGSGKIVVCVTGASGYVASWLVKLLLERGYIVKATVRNLGDIKKVVHLKELEGATERLQLFEANLLEEGSFDSVFDGCDGVFHTASPVILSVNDPQTELLDPAVKGTLNVLKSCNKAKSVRRVVITSSVVAVTTNRNPIGPDVIVDETWFSDPEFCKETEQWYHLSKTLAEEAAWKFAKENGIDLVMMHPGFVIGPLLQPTLNFSSACIIDIVKGKEGLPTCDFVDVRDVGYAHILAFENSTANERYILVGTVICHHDLQQTLKQLYPSLNFPENVAKNPVMYQLSSIQEERRKFGCQFHPS